MTKYKPVSIPRDAFSFCRYSLSILLWLSLFFHEQSLLLLVAVILLLSYLLKIKKAPMIWLYSSTINKFIKSTDQIVNENAMSFAHAMGFILSLTCLGLMAINETVGWYAVLAFAVLKSISALGFCPASKLYECLGNGSCCALTKKHD